MYKVGDSVQCFSFNNWYDAKILSKTPNMAESYIVHYKGWNKRYDEVKYLKDIREPQKIIMDPIPGVNDNSENDSEPMELKKIPKKRNQQNNKNTRVGQCKGGKIQPTIVRTKISKTAKRNNNGIVAVKSKPKNSRILQIESKFLKAIEKISPNAVKSAQERFLSRIEKIATEMIEEEKLISDAGVKAEILHSDDENDITHFESFKN